MIAGTDCPMCEDAHLPTNPGSDLIAELEWSYARLGANQTKPGYCLVILKEHRAELDDLSAAELAGFWTDVARVAGAIRSVVHPVKLDYLVMGHRVPHLHCHLYPHFEDDDPFANPDISAGSLRLEPAETRERLKQLRVALQQAKPST
jgi:diadenosine tetraphosphate (Ap4A) HIT family hydrolase